MVKFENLGGLGARKLALGDKIWADAELLSVLVFSPCCPTSIRNLSTFPKSLVWCNCEVDLLFRIFGRKVDVLLLWYRLGLILFSATNRLVNAFVLYDGCIIGSYDAIWCS